MFTLPKLIKIILAKMAKNYRLEALIGSEEPKYYSANSSLHVFHLKHSKLIPLKDPTRRTKYSIKLKDVVKDKNSKNKHFIARFLNCSLICVYITIIYTMGI